MISKPQLALLPHICWIFLIAVFIADWAPSYALNRDYPLSKYIHSSWGSNSGLFTVRHVAQTPDGYLWLATSGGLVRFDGVRFTTYARASEQSLDNSSDLTVDPDGSLWVATFGGVITHFQAGRFHSYNSRDGLPSDYIQAVYRDSKGVLWVGTRNAGVFQMVHGHFEKVPLDIPPSLISRFIEGTDQSLWIATYGNGVFRLQSGRLQAFSVKDGLPDNHVGGLCRDHSGRVWTVGLKGISSWNGSRFVTYPAVNSVVGFASACTEDRDGNLWISSVTSGLIRLRDGQVAKMDASSGLSANNVQDVYEDREGNLWVATDAGVDRLTDAQVRTFTELDGLFRGTEAVQWPIAADHSAGVWAASGTRVGRIAGGQITQWPLTLPRGSRANAVLSNRDSGFLLGFDGGIKDWSPARSALIPETAEMYVRCLLQARDGSVWVATANQGLLHWTTHAELQTKFEKVVSDKFITSLAEGHDGVIWAGSHGGGLYRIAGQQIQHFGQAEGLPSSNIFTVFVDREGVLRIGSVGGLSWFQDGRIRTVSAEQGLRSDLVFAILDDSYDRLWLMGHAGIAAIEKKSLNEWAEGRRRQLNPKFYRSAEGLPLWTVDWAFPNATQSVDGHLWFAFADGLAEVTPPNPRTAHEFPVIVEDVTIDNVSHSEPGRIQIPSGARSVEVRYTALTLTNSETVQFRYRLEGIDDDWIDVNTRRIALYSNLKPGTYTFKVEASAGEGQWMESSPLLLEQIPFFYQTKWFLILITATALSLIYLMYRMRLRVAVDRINADFQQRIDERTRIARDLHDTLLQSLNALLLRLQTVSNVLPTQPYEAKRRIDRAIEQASSAVTEGRDTLFELRSSTSTSIDFDRAIGDFARELLSGSRSETSPEFHVRVEGKSRALNSIVRDEVYRIVTEAIRNAIRHANAHRIEVEVRYDEHRLQLWIGDDGTGIVPAVLESGHKTGHWGLRGMRERAKLVGGTLQVWSQVNSGTEIELAVPAESAYGKSPTSNRTIISRILRS